MSYEELWTDSCWLLKEGESLFFMGMARRLTKLQWTASKPKVYGQHKLEMINLILKKDDAMLGAVRR